MYEYKAQVIQVQDAGFFLNLAIDLGFDTSKLVEVELKGVEGGPTEEKEQVARDKLRVLLSSNNDTVRVRTEKDEFGYYLAEVYVGDVYVNQFVAELLARE